MTANNKLLAQKIYLILGALFITSLVVSNLIFQKFFYWHPFDIRVFGIDLFVLSVGILPYPITFLITDLISEIYGKKKANLIVIVGIFASIFSILIITVADTLPAIQIVEIKLLVMHLTMRLSMDLIILRECLKKLIN